MVTIWFAAAVMSVIPISLEIGGGGVFPATPETTTPGIFWEAGITGEVAGEWHLSVSMASWSSSNFDPGGGAPQWLSEETERVSYQGCDMYEEGRTVLQLGLRRAFGGVLLGLSGGLSERVSSYSFDGDIDGPTEFEIENRCFAAGISARAAVGDAGYLDLSAISEELESIMVSLSFGTALRLIGGGS